MHVFFGNHNLISIKRLQHPKVCNPYSNPIPTLNNLIYKYSNNPYILPTIVIQNDQNKDSIKRPRRAQNEGCRAKEGMAEKEA